MYYYDLGFNYPCESGSSLPAVNTQQILIVINPQNSANIEKTSNNNTLLCGGLTCLAILGTYLITKGHYKGKFPSTNTAASHTAKQTAKPINYS